MSVLLVEVSEGAVVAVAGGALYALRGESWCVVDTCEGLGGRVLRRSEAEALVQRVGLPLVGVAS